ncbi:sterol carrier protein 2 [Drosophila virilis]|uniref:Uncharacterized protein, isoform B n=1 Tax=Drosophila virilis TaxID=7244 RepID=B4LT81_DROVI|nr:non-specific lipid-transfer protein [Drosophila virilis]EDW64923.2 uncharacterized protein Dvir_GJ17743, isoform B [Drosophila virilis]
MRTLQDANFKCEEVQQAAVDYVYGESNCRQHAVYEVGMTCSTAVHLPKQHVEFGNANCVLTLVGFEKMEQHDPPGLRASEFAGCGAACLLLGQ